MDCFSSTIHEYQPILVGAGCLALGYMYGRHCRSVMENRLDEPSMSDAACSAGTESVDYNPESAAAMVDPETMAIVRQWLNPTKPDWDFSDRELTEKPERCAKRDLEILPRKKEDMIWNQNVLKKQKSEPAVRREVVRTKPESEKDSDDDLLAQRLEFFTRTFSGTRASINKKRTRTNDDRHDVATSCEEAKNAQEIAINTSRKGVARSFSGLGALASPQEDDNQGESSPGSSVEDTCRSPKTVCLSDGDDEDDEQDDVFERSCQVDLTNSASQAETVALVPVKCTLSNDIAFDRFVGDGMAMGLKESKDKTVVESQSDDSPNARMEVDAHKKVDPAMRLELPTSPPPELIHGEQEGKGMKKADAAAVPAIDEGEELKVEINERLLQLARAGAADGHKKMRNKESTRSCCFGATAKPIQFRWLKKLATCGKKRSNLCKHPCNNKQQQQPEKMD